MSIMHPRVQALLNAAQQAGVDAIALIPGANLRYITGIDFHLMERPLVVFFAPGTDPVAVLPTLEADRLAGSGIPMNVFPWSDSDGYLGTFAAALNSLNLAGKRLGVEELQMRVLEAQIIQQHAPDVRLVPIGASLAELRLRKDESALAHLRDAIRISEAALQATIEQVKPGMSEREIAGILTIEQLRRGGGKHPFEPIVLSGPNSALPHGEPGERRVVAGEPLLFDFGTTVRGYVSDITRTFSVGEPSARLKEVYKVVQAANAAGRAAANPGVMAQDVDRITRKVIHDAGYGAFFSHRTGHGLGLEAHEGPNIVEGSAQVLEPGMVFTIEPGIYLAGEFGVRIEDNMVITPTGAESLTTFSRDLLIIGA